MLQGLRSRRVEKRPDRVRLAGRVLFLTVDPDLVRRQLEGEDLAWRPGIALRDDISTDEITPAYICYYYDETLGDFPYLGLKCGEQFPITRGAVKRGGFVASVSGKRRGKGSSLAAHRGDKATALHRADRKSTRLNSSHVSISYAVF